MALSMINGAVVASDLKQRRKTISIFRTVRFALADGGERTLKNVVVMDDVAPYLEPGARGRFYLYNYLDQRGVHGFRSAEATASAFAFPSQNERIFQIVFFVNVLWICLRLFVIGDGIPLLGVGLMIIGAIGWVWGRKTRIEAQRQFEDDAGVSMHPGPQGQPA